MDTIQFQQINKRLDLIVTLLALNLVKDAGTQKEKILTLSSLGLKPAEIAALLGTTPNTVSVALSEVKKKNKKEPPTITPESDKSHQQQTLTEGAKDVK